MSFRRTHPGLSWAEQWSNEQGPQGHRMAWGLKAGGWFLSGLPPGLGTRSGFTLQECKPQWLPCLSPSDISLGRLLRNSGSRAPAWDTDPGSLAGLQPNHAGNKVPGQEAGRCYFFCRNCRKSPSDFAQIPAERMQFLHHLGISSFQRTDKICMGLLLQTQCSHFFPPLPAWRAGLVCVVEWQGKVGLTMSLDAYWLCEIREVIVPLGLQFLQPQQGNGQVGTINCEDVLLIKMPIVFWQLCSLLCERRMLHSNTNWESLGSKGASLSGSFTCFPALW